MMQKGVKKSFWVLNRREMKSLISLLILIGFVIFLPICFEKIYLNSPLSEDTRWMNQIQMDTLLETYSESSQEIHFNKELPSISKDSLKIGSFFFDPNKASFLTWKKFHIPDFKIQRILKYILKGGHFYKPEDLHKIYGLNDGEIQTIIPFVKISENLKSEKTYPNFRRDPKIGIKSFPYNTSEYKIPLNSARFQDFWRTGLLNRNEIWDIINFRERNGPFSDIRELKNLKLVDISTYNKIEKKLTLK